MKRICALTLLILIALSACQPTPKKPIVVSKGDGKLEDILAGSYPAQLSEPYNAPQTWTETIDGIDENKLLIEVDAKINVPKSLSYPVYHASFKQLSQSEANSFIKYFIGDEKLYDYGDRTQTDAHLQKMLELAEYNLSDPTSPLHTQYHDEGEPQSAYDMVKRSAEFWREFALKKLTMTKDGIETEPLFENAHRPNKTMLFLYTYDLSKKIGIKDEKAGRLVSYNPNDENNVWLRYTFPYTENLIDLTIDIEKARDWAAETVDGLGYGSWNLVNEGAVGIDKDDFVDILWDLENHKSLYEQPQGYWFTYTPEIYKDVPLLYYSNNDGDYTRSASLISDYAPSAGFSPSLHIAVFDDGVRYCILHSSMQVEGMVNRNVPLLPFEEIQNIFRRYIIMKINFSNLYERGDHTTPAFEQSRIEIDNIKLGYMKIREKNTGAYLLMPVWMFYGCQYDHYTDQEGAGMLLDKNNDRFGDTPAGYTFLIINAVDGSIINPLSAY